MGEGLGGASTCLLVATAGAIVSYIPIGALAAKIGRKRTIQCGIVLLATCFMLGYLLTTMYTSIQPIMYVVFALVGLAWAAINVNSLPMVVEMCRGSDIGKYRVLLHLLDGRAGRHAHRGRLPDASHRLPRTVSLRRPVCSPELCNHVLRQARRHQSRGKEGAGCV